MAELLDHLPLIMNTKVSLERLNSEHGEAESMEATIADFGEIMGRLLSDNTADDYGRDLLKTRQRILKGLTRQIKRQKLDPTSVSLKDLDLGQFAEQSRENDVEQFTSQNQDAVTKILGDNAYKHGQWDNNVALYIRKAVAESLGVS